MQVMAGFGGGGGAADGLNTAPLGADRPSSLSDDAAALVSNATNAGCLDIGTIQFAANHSFDIPPCIRHGSRLKFFGRRCPNGKPG